jgi:hypothetical protein
MRKTIFVLVLAGLVLVGVAAAGNSQGWTVTFAEKEAHRIRYVDSREVREVSAALTRATYAQRACLEAGKKDCTFDAKVMAQAKRAVVTAKRGHLATSARCRSDGPSNDSHHFKRFRCEMTFAGLWPDPEHEGDDGPTGCSLSEALYTLSSHGKGNCDSNPTYFHHVIRVTVTGPRTFTWKVIA